MESLGNLNLLWTRGYNGSKVQYVDADHFCFVSGKTVVFVDEDGEETLFEFKGATIKSFSVHTSNKCFAIGEQIVSPNIYIYNYPELEQISILKGVFTYEVYLTTMSLANKISLLGEEWKLHPATVTCFLDDDTKVEFTMLAFSASDYLASLSGVPDYKLSIWKYEKCEKLCSALLNQPEPNSISFNPTNWRCLCITSKKKITLWQIERCSTLHTLKYREIKPPPADPDALPEIEEEKPLKSVSESSFLLFEKCLHMPVSSQTGLVGILAEKWVGSLQDKIVRVIPISQAWTPTGDLFIGCLEGELLKIDGESFKVTVIYHPSTQILLPPSDANTEQSNTVSEHCNAEKEARGYTSDVTFECLGVHRKGLFAAGRNGNLNLVTVCKDKVTITNQKRIGNSVSSLAFSPSYKKIVLGSPQGIIQLFDTQNTDRDLSIVVNHHNGDFVGIGCLCPGTSHAVTVREDGFVQVWKLKTGFLIGSLKTGKNACSLACSPTSETVAVGTESGFLFILDLTDKTKPRIIHCIHLCSDKLSHLVYEDSGLYLFSASRSGYVFVISGKTAQNFSVLGYTVTKGPVIAMATSTVNNKVHVLVSVKITVDEKKVASKIIFFHIDTDFKNVIYKSLKLDFDDDSIEQYEAGKLSILHGLAVKGRYIYTISDASLKLLKLFCKDKRRKQPREELSLLITQKDYPAHSLAGGDVLLSPGGHWLVTCGGDGSVHLYLFSMLCRNPPDVFCYVCGQFIVKAQKRTITPEIKKIYKLYFDCPLGDQDKLWAPPCICSACSNGLRDWFNKMRIWNFYFMPLPMKDTHGKYVEI